MPAKQNCIELLLKFDLDGYVFNPHRPEGINFKDDQDDYTFEIRSKRQNDDRQAGYDQLEVVGTILIAADDSEIEFVDRFIERPWIEIDTLLASGRVDNSYIEKYGEPRFRQSWDDVPQGLASRVERAAQGLRDGIERFFGLVRWLGYWNGPEVSFLDSDPREGLYWRTNQVVYYSAPQSKGQSLTIHSQRDFRWDEEFKSLLEDCWETKSLTEPLAHQLLREAKQLHDGNERSALLIGFSALEVAVKKHISGRVPDARWLIEELQAPSVYRLFVEYLPQLHRGNDLFHRFQQKLEKELDVLKAFSLDRNYVAHRGEKKRSYSVSEYLRVAEDVVYFVDVLDGHEWAKNNVSSTFANAMGWDRDGITEYSVTMRRS